MATPPAVPDRGGRSGPAEPPPREPEAVHRPKELYTISEKSGRDVIGGK
ncbi:hypothetical protein [Methanoculleus chikugoensis]|nr:hypothetical protein [Methanoculleus chikugoensis]